MDTIIEMERSSQIQPLPAPGRLSRMEPVLDVEAELEKVARFMDRGITRADLGQSEHDLGRLEVGLCVLRAKEIIAHGMSGLKNNPAGRNQHVEDESVIVTDSSSGAEDHVKFGKAEAGLVMWIKHRFPTRSYETISRWRRWAEKQIPKILALKQQLHLELDDVRRLDVSQLAEPQRQLLLTTIADRPPATPGGDVTPRDADGRRIQRPKRTGEQMARAEFESSAKIWATAFKTMAENAATNTSPEGAHYWDTQSDAYLEELEQALHVCWGGVKASRERRKAVRRGK